MKPSPGAVILAYIRLAALGVATAATLVMLYFVAGRLLGYPMREHSLGNSALIVWCFAVATYFGCRAFAQFTDRRRGL